MPFIKRMLLIAFFNLKVINVNIEFFITLINIYTVKDKI